MEIQYYHIGLLFFVPVFFYENRHRLIIKFPLLLLCIGAFVLIKIFLKGTVTVDYILRVTNNCCVLDTSILGLIQVKKALKEQKKQAALIGKTERRSTPLPRCRGGEISLQRPLSPFSVKGGKAAKAWASQPRPLTNPKNYATVPLLRRKGLYSRACPCAESPRLVEGGQGAL